MGPVLLSHKGKDGIYYNLRAIPIGGYVSMAGEVYEDDDLEKIPKEKFMCNKSWWQRLIILVAGVTNNFILAIILLFVSASIWGTSAIEPIVLDVAPGFVMERIGLAKDDKIVAINNKKITTWDEANIVLARKNNNVENYYYFVQNYGDYYKVEQPIVKVKDVDSIYYTKEEDYYKIQIVYKNQEIKEMVIKNIELNNTSDVDLSIKDVDIITKDATLYIFTINRDGENIDYELTTTSITKIDTNEVENYFGIAIKNADANGILGKVKYAFAKFASIVKSMVLTITSLITGKISLKALSVPVGMYKVVEQARSIGWDYIVYITAFLSINVGVINILPFPAFDGGRVFFLIVEKIKGSPVNSKFENTCHTIGFFLLIALMIYITIQDIIRLF